MSLLPTTGRGGMMTTLHRLRRRINVDQRLFLVFIVFISVFIVQSENSHLASKSEEPDHHQSAVMASKGLPQPIRLPSNFDAQLEQDGVILKKERQQQQWHGDHGTVEESGRGFGRRGGRLLWPFTIEVTKGKAGDHKHHHTHGGWGGPDKFGSYTAWASEGNYGTPGGTGPGGFPMHPAFDHGGHSLGLDGKEMPHFQYPLLPSPIPPTMHGWGGSGHVKRGMTDEEILKSKHYHTYIKKKQKYIKILKRKLKLKRLIQKVLQKHIVKKAEIAPY